MTSEWGTVGADYYNAGYDGGGILPEHDEMMYGFSNPAAAKSSNLSQVATVEAKKGNLNAAISAETGKLQAETAANSAAAPSLASAVFEPFVWAKKTITWTLDTSTGAGTPFTASLGSQYESEVQQAFQTWAKASEMHFVEVSGPNADINIGLAELDSSHTGIQGLSTVHAPNGIAGSADIMLEDPTEDALATDAKGQAAYTGTQTELEQLLLHEIGHVLGLGNNSDSGSIMASALSNANDTLDATDTQAIEALYGPSASGKPSTIAVNYWNNIRAESAQLVQSMAGFTGANTIALSSANSFSPVVNPIQLAAPH